MTANIQTIIDKNKQNKQGTYYLEEGNYVTGYNATLIYVMSGLVKAVYVLGTYPKKKFEILSNNCQIASVPLFQLTSPIEEFEDVKVLAVVADS
ncbi:MAG: hypothetical protein ACFFAJ_04105 [Candidatus Hodarchaeota archaeon]